jgi:hypothetical protein
MKIDVPTYEDLSKVANGMRARDVAEFSAVNKVDNAFELATLMKERYAHRQDTFCVYDGETPVGIGAMIEGRPNVITLMFFATDELPNVVLGLTKFIKRELFPNYRKNGAHRIECVSIDGYEETHRWIETLGLKREAVLRGYGKNGEAFHQFAWVADHVR